LAGAGLALSLALFVALAIGNFRSGPATRGLEEPEPGTSTAPASSDRWFTKPATAPTRPVKQQPPGD